MAVMTPELFISISALIVSLIALGLSVFFWLRSFRPIVSPMVKTSSSGDQAITYNLVLLNSGSIPARNVRLQIRDKTRLEEALGSGANAENRERWLACFEEKNTIKIIHNGDSVSCSFGHTKPNDKGFWKHRASIPIRIKYDGWFPRLERSYVADEEIEIRDSDSFTGYMWGKGNRDTNAT